MAIARYALVLLNIVGLFFILIAPNIFVNLQGGAIGYMATKLGGGGGWGGGGVLLERPANVIKVLKFLSSF